MCLRTALVVTLVVATFIGHLRPVDSLYQDGELRSKRESSIETSSAASESVQSVACIQEIVNSNLPAKQKYLLLKKAVEDVRAAETAKRETERAKREEQNKKRSLENQAKKEEMVKLREENRKKKEEEQMKKKDEMEKKREENRKKNEARSLLQKKLKENEDRFREEKAKLLSNNNN